MASGLSAAAAHDRSDDARVDNSPAYADGEVPLRPFVALVQAPPSRKHGLRTTATRSEGQFRKTRQTPHREQCCDFQRIALTQRGLPQPSQGDGASAHPSSAILKNTSSYVFTAKTALTLLRSILRYLKDYGFVRSCSWDTIVR
jgi:hypothetical protein